MPSVINTCTTPVLRPDFGVAQVAATTEDALSLRDSQLAAQILTDARFEGVDDSRLRLIVRAAASAKELLFSAMLHEPTEWELDEFSEDFIRRCVMDPDAQDAR